MAQPENPFVFGEVVDDRNFVDRTDELSHLVRDLADGQKVFLLSPRRFGKSSLASVAFLKLQKRHIHAVNLTISSYSSYAQFLEKFAERCFAQVALGTNEGYGEALPAARQARGQS